MTLFDYISAHPWWTVFYGIVFSFVFGFARGCAEATFKRIFDGRAKDAAEKR